MPGPACYGRGGTRPTVTDADLVLGRIPAAAAFPGLGTLDLDAAGSALDAAGVDAAGVVAVVDAQMEQALRTVSIERGVDPSGLALVAFGGAGPLHACDLAEATGIPVVIVPAAAGVLSAVGLLTSPQRRDVVRSWPHPQRTDGLDVALAELEEQAVAALDAAPGAVVTTSTSLDCRYAGQSHELRVGDLSEFAAVHRERNGYDLPGASIEVIALRAAAEAPAPAGIEDVLARQGDEAVDVVDVVHGPRVVARADCTIWVPPGWSGEPGPLGSLVLTRSARAL